MTLNEGSSFVVSSTVSLLLFSGMQVYKAALASSQLLTIATGFLGALLYVFLLTAVANLEKTVFGFNFQSKLGEVSLAVTAVFLFVITKISLKFDSRALLPRWCSACWPPCPPPGPCTGCPPPPASSSHSG